MQTIQLVYSAVTLRHMAYDAEATRQRILAAATEEFAERGIAGARVDRIAAKAKANKQAIYAYFGNKEALFSRVLQNVMGELAATAPVDAADLGGYAARLYDYHRAHPEFLRLLLWEALEYGDREVPDEADRTKHYEQKAGAMAKAQREGLIDEEIDPSVLMLFVIGLVNWGRAVPQVRRMLGADLSPEQARRQIATAVARLANQDAQ
ncbi:TetR family transcriptional regulator [Flindersiella endophytica]